MALLTRGLYDSDLSFTPLFRLLDEFDNYSREARGNSSNNNNNNNSSSSSSSNERLRHRARQHVSTFSPKFDVRETDTAYELYGELPGIERNKINIEFTDAQTLVIRGRTERNYSVGNPTAGLLENDGEQNSVEHAVSPKESSGNGEESTSVEKPKASSEKYWVQERSIGEFARTFSFPSHVDQDAVTAKLNNGILSLVVPKAKRAEARRIAID